MSLDVTWLSCEGPGAARATTLGAGGLFVRTEAAPPEGTSIRVRFRLPGSSVLQVLDGRIAWVHSPADAGPHAPGMGIAFSDADAIARLARALDETDRSDDPEEQSA